MHLKNNKATGPDDIPAEALKTDIDTSLELLYPFFTDIWEKKEVPSEWRDGYLIKLPKKETSATVLTTEESHFYQCPGKSSTE